MHIYWREIRAGRKSFAIWSAGLFLLLVASMGKYDTLKSGGEATRQIMERFPATMQAFFGMNGLDVLSLVGYFGVLLLYVFLMAAIYAGLMGAGIFTKEQQGKTAEFLYVRPVSRARIVTEKVCSGVTYCIVFAVILYISSRVAVAPYGSINHEIFLFSVGFLLIELLFFSLGCALAAWARGDELPAKGITFVVVVAYLIYVIVQLFPTLNWLEIASPFLYFDAEYIIAHSTLKIGVVVVSLSATALLGILTYVGIQRRDITI